MAGLSSPTVALSPHEIAPGRPMAQQVHDAIRRAILTLALKPGEALSEKELALRLGVSRTPVREALIKLSDEGLVDVFPQRGTLVAPIRIAEVMEAQFVREALETAVVRRAAEQADGHLTPMLAGNIEAQAVAARTGERDAFLRLDEAFHRSLSEAVALPRAWKTIQNVKGQLDRVRFLSLPEAGQLATLTGEHADIAEAIRLRDPDLAAERMKHHLQAVFGTVRKLMREQPALFN